MSDKQYPCPVCEKPFTAKQQRDNKKRCPYCNVPVKSERYKATDGKKGFYYKYLVDDKKTAGLKQVVVKQSEPEEPPPNPNWWEDEGELVGEKHDVPQVYLLDKGVLTEEGLREKRKFRVVYINKAFTGYVYCPGCYKPLVQNRRVHSTLDQEHICRNNKCKSTVLVLCVRQQPFQAT